MALGVYVGEMRVVPTLRGSSALLDWAVAGRLSDAVVVASHPRSGTHLMLDALRWHQARLGAFKLPGEPLERVYVEANQLSQGTPRRVRLAAAATLARTRRALIKTHRLPGFEPWLSASRQPPLAPALRCALGAEARTIYMVRDGRAATFSYYLLSTRMGALGQLSFSRFLREPTPVAPEGGARSWASHVRKWLASDALVVDYAQLLHAPMETLTRVFDYLGLPPSRRAPPLPPRLAGPRAYERARWFAGRPPSTAVLASALPTPPWRDALSVEDARFFQDATAGLLQELGHEESGDWWRR